MSLCLFCCCCWCCAIVVAVVVMVFYYCYWNFIKVTNTRNVKQLKVSMFGVFVSCCFFWGGGGRGVAIFNMHANIRLIGFYRKLFKHSVSYRRGYACERKSLKMKHFANAVGHALEYGTISKISKIPNIFGIWCGAKPTCLGIFIVWQPQVKSYNHTNRQRHIFFTI